MDQTVTSEGYYPLGRLDEDDPHFRHESDFDEDD